MQGEMHAVAPIIGGGDTGRIVRQTDWSATPLGDYSTWPQSLRSALSMVLNTKGIAALYWGPEQWLLYNDAYGSALGDRHPWAFGRPMAEALSDIAPVIGPQIAAVLRTGSGFAVENVPIVMHRYGRNEETYWTYGFSPIQGESNGFAGVLLLATEMTQQRTIEAALRESETRLANALASANLGTFEWNTISGDVRMDADARRIFAFPTDGPIHQDEVFGRIVSDQVERIAAEAAHAAQRGARLALNYDIVLPNGDRRHVVSSCVPMDGGSRMIGVFQDGTKLKDAERSLVALNETLESRVAEQVAERNLLATLVETTDVIILAADRAYNLLAINAAAANEFERIYGLRAR